MVSATSETSTTTYKSFIKPIKFWQKSERGSSIDELIKRDYCEEEDKNKQVAKKKLLPSASSFSFAKKKSAIVALKESGETEVYKLSTIDDTTGLYIPPSPTLESKRDHWVEINEEDIMDFYLPMNSECLTSHVNERHEFYTPSSYVKCQPYIFYGSVPTTKKDNDDDDDNNNTMMNSSTLSSVPSLVDDETLEDLTSVPSYRSNTTITNSN
ncbi:uncharacterized protein BX663DRAFT_526581 [Cokeromyces recurvatus]|uniref:uncharacterized protein n=1 Tax=Cokeromyces recurvatus TaxID=90255 RepID=UPI00221F8F98|nr:uncharacterized protein BX663DRAFT_526581 [Cokeromyces recurvatus]KAI7897956.1 hypothetical protein BX663DRAFT_526581 [Cokeromyces recurvatus]